MTIPFNYDLSSYINSNDDIINNNGAENGAEKMIDEIILDAIKK